MLVMAVIGVVLMRRSGHRAEAWTIAAVAIAYFLYNAGYWQPYGGGTPGPRFLIPALPFVAIGLAFAYRRSRRPPWRWRSPRGWMVVATITYPLLGEQGTRSWVRLSPAGCSSTRCSRRRDRSELARDPALPVADRRRDRLRRHRDPAARPVDRADLATAAGALAAWVVVAVLGPTIAGDPVTPLDGGSESFVLIGAGALLAALVLLALPALADPSSGRRPRRRPAELALGDRPRRRAPRRGGRG